MLLLDFDHQRMVSFSTADLIQTDVNLRRPFSCLDYPPDRVEDIYEELEESVDPAALIKNLSAQESGWLASIIRSKSQGARDRATEEISKEANVSHRLVQHPTVEF